ncbi:type II secretion system F family protein [Alicyclobacillus fodiniaquatilis]|uniref:Type II secretion system F family protein n=1 Tax=Alicyclobacillus fodiniaquatilis TaxID=1661150 RepID=A0ABW4JI82_9BACL
MLLLVGFGVFVVLSGALLAQAKIAAIQSVVSDIKTAFQGRSRGTLRTSLLHKMYGKYQVMIDQTQVSTTPQALERKQWIFGGGGAIAGYALGHHIILALIFGGLGFVYPVQDLKSKAKRIQKAISAEMRPFLLFLTIQIETGAGNIEALRNVRRRLEGPLGDIIDHVMAMLRTKTFSEALLWAAERTGHEDFRTIAIVIQQGNRYGSSIQESLRSAMRTLDDEEETNKMKQVASYKFGIYTKFIGFFAMPLLLDILLFVWQMISGVFTQI